MGDWDPVLGIGNEDITLVPTCDGYPHVVEMDKSSWSDIMDDEQPAMGTAPPALFEEDFDDDYADYSTIVKAPMPLAGGRMPTSALLPQSALPAALPVRPNLGTSPPPRPETPACSPTPWQVSELEPTSPLVGWTRPHWPATPTPHRQPVSLKRRPYIFTAWSGAALAFGVACAALLAALAL